MNGIRGQENVENALDIENEIVDEPPVIDQNVTECPGSVQNYLKNTTRSLFLSEIMPEIEAELAQKDEVISQLNSSIYELKVNFIVVDDRSEETTLYSGANHPFPTI